MFEIVPSQWMKKCFEEIGFAFTDFQKATLIWNAPGRLRQEILDALEELSEETKDETLRRQINERLNYEKRTFKTFIHNQSGKYVYVVEDLAERICQMDETEITTEVLTTIEESDILDVPLEERRQIKKIGFAC